MTDYVKITPGPIGVETPKAILFDLDGTLIDTVGDISIALNRALEEQGISSVPVSQVRKMIGRGASILVERATASIGVDATFKLHAELVERFLHHGERLYHLKESRSVLFEGVARALTQLSAAGLALAVVTNKQRALALEALSHAGVGEAFRCVVGGDTCEQRKPDPAPLLHACSVIGVQPSHAVMVGDSMNDVLAARAAGIPVLCVPYGYNEGMEPRELPCDGFIERLDDLPARLGIGGTGVLQT